MATVVVCAPLDLAWLHRQQWLRAIQSLNLRFLIDAEDQRILRWIQVEADDVANLLDE